MRELTATLKTESPFSYINGHKPFSYINGHKIAQPLHHYLAVRNFLIHTANAKNVILEVILIKFCILRNKIKYYAHFNHNNKRTLKDV